MKKCIHAGCVGLFIINFISAFSSLFVPTASAMMIAPVGYSNVAFIPGLEASRLYVPGLVFENKLWEPNRNADVDKLAMDTNGKSIRNDVYTKDVIDNVGALFFKSDVYDGFIKYMNGLVINKTINGWATLPYDWRLGFSDIVNGGIIDANNRVSYLASTTPDVSYMISQIQSLANRSITGKVTLVTHSNGGLVAKVLIQKLQDLKAQGQGNLIDKIDRVIMIAAPQLGAVDAIGSLLHGYKLHYVGGLVLNENHARAMAENMPGAYNLLPSPKYFENNTNPIITFATSTDTFSNLSKSYGRNISDYNSLKKFLTGADGRQDPSFGDAITPNVLNKTLINNAEKQHAAIDNWQFPSSIDVTQVAGVGVKTLSGIQYVKGSVCSNDIMICKDVLDPEPVFSDSGDGTVLSSSAILSGAKQLYFDINDYNNGDFGSKHTTQHSNILEASPIQATIKGILKGDLILPEFISSNKPQYIGKQLLVVAHSPITLDAYDEKGNHTGLINNPDSNSDIQLVEQNIPNSFYVKFGEGKYLGLDMTASTTVSFQGTDYGSFTIDTNVSENGMVIASSTFVDIPVTPEMKGSIMNISSSPVLALDIDGDGIVDVTTTANKAFDPILYIEIMKKTVDSFNLKKLPEKLLIAALNRLEDLIKKGKIKNVEKQIKKLMKTIDRKNNRSHKISDNERGQIVQMLTNLIRNLI
jgi:predicted aconitase with swiveling domain